MTEFEPQAFGRYYLVDKIAVGGMAEVFKAKSFSHGGFEKLQVIKRILQHHTANAEFVEMFVDEAKISVELQHPNIVQTYDFGKIRENYFIAMECVEGKDVKGILRKLAERRKLLPPEFAAFIAHEMCKGLDYAHKRTNLRGELLGIVHRDISPSNILVSYHGEIKIADFGIAKAQISLFNTKDGVLKGKFEYMSPEQASGRDIDARSDLFAAGIILHEMLTGRRLFKTDSDVKTLEKIKSVDVTTPRQLNAHVPVRLDEICMRALARDPAARFADAREMQSALADYLYPVSLDVTRESLAHFLQELFSQDIAAERTRLEEGSRIATQLWEAAPELDLDEEWEPGQTGTGTLETSTNRLPLALALLALLGVMAIGAGALLWLQTREPEVVEKVVEVEAPEPTHGSVQLTIEPEGVTATFYLGDQEIGTGGSLLYEELPPVEDLDIRVEADGYEPFTDTVNVAAGERLRVPVKLTPRRGARPAGERPAQERPADAVPTETPRPPAGQAGQAATQAPAAPTAGRSGGTEVAQPSRATGPGRLSVNVGSGWADIYIDGKKVDTTPLFNHSLSAGSHTVQVVNTTNGLDETRVVTVVSGETLLLAF